MGVLDFLFEGRPPTSVNTYGQTTENIPRWMSDYTQGLIARANVIAAEPYQAYEGPRISGFSPEQEQAFQAVQQNMGRADPYMASALGSTQQAAGADPFAAAQPYLQGAGQTFTGGNVEQYMDPYVQNVLDRQESMASRTLEEKFLPQLGDVFTRGGQYGSERQQELAQRGVRDISENLEQQRLGTLSQAYEQAGQRQATDAARQAQLAGLTGQMSLDQGRLGLQAGQQYGALGEMASQQGLRDAAAMEAVGQQRQQMGQRSMDLAYDDFMRQQQYPRENIDWMSQIIRGMPMSKTTEQVQTGPADTYGPSPLSQLASGYSLWKGMQNPQGYAKGGLVHIIEGECRRVEDA